MFGSHPLRLDIAILAYNEQICVGDVLQDIVNSRQEGRYSLQNVFVISDASTDQTDEIVQRFSQDDARVKLIRKPRRKGKSDSMNLAITLTDSDILVILDADIRFSHENTLEYLVAPIYNNQAELVGANIIPVKPELTFNPARLARHFDWILEDEMRNRKPISYWSSYGRALALSKDFYRNLNLPRSQADDLFIYYSCLAGDYKFAYASDAIIYFEAPKSLGDYIRQFSRFEYYTERVRKHFGKELIDSDMIVHGMARFLLLSLVRYPHCGIAWMVCHAVSRVAYLFNFDSSRLAEGLYKTASRRVKIGRKNEDSVFGYRSRIH